MFMKNLFGVMLTIIVLLAIYVVADMGTTGNMIVQGNITTNQFYGEMWSKNNAVTTPILSQNAYVNVTQGINSSNNNGFTMTSDGFLRCDVPGHYFAVAGTSAMGGNNKNFHNSIGINGTDQDNCHRARKLSAADLGVWTVPCGLDLRKGDTVSIMAENKGDDTDLTVNDASLIIWRVGDT